MATRTIVETTCDMPAHRRPPAATGYELYSKATGARHTIDLCDSCYAKVFGVVEQHGAEILKGRAGVAKIPVATQPPRPAQQ